jgi:hypothetical protein
MKHQEGTFKGIRDATTITNAGCQKASQKLYY